VLQIKAALPVIRRDLQGLTATLADLARRERDTLMPGRTHGQHSTPITFGYKVAVWLDEVRRHIARLEECAARVLVGEFGGASGTLASVSQPGDPRFGGEDLAFQIRARLMAEVGLSLPGITWHAARDRLAELILVLAMIASTMGKIAHEVILLQKSEVMELEEPFHMGKVGSSTMPHKRNPMGCEGIMALARLVRALAPAMLESMGVAEHERDWATVHTEWAVVPEACILTGAAVAQTLEVLRDLIVYRKKMRADVDILHGLILSEAVMLKLGEYVGRQIAHDLVYEAAMAAYEQGRPLKEMLLEDPRIAGRVSAGQMDEILRPESYTGVAGAFVDRLTWRSDAG
jgi:adenylosuccinate lyase